MSGSSVSPRVKWFRDPDRLAMFALLGLLFAFYPELFLVKAASLTGDHLEQHYPWAYLLAQSIKQFRLPFWTSQIQCGFPLVAESQVGAFYLPNLIMYFCLPFKMAYSYVNLVHWFIGGWGTYFYARQMKLGAMASFVAVLIFVFGGAYGGAYYNMTSLKTICWFPIALYLFEKNLSKPLVLRFCILGLVIGQSLVAGYLQMAVFTWLIFGVYASLRIMVFPEVASSWARKALNMGSLGPIAAIAFLLALPQIYLTFKLAMMSNRTGLEEGYAYVGSMSPMVVGTLICPNLSNLFKGNNMYPGAFALFLSILSFGSPETRQNKAFRLWGALTLIALFLALGQWSPLYVGLVKLTKFYSFRIPAKFIGFICFGFAMMSAIGFQALWERSVTRAVVKKAFYVYLAVLAFFLSVVAFVAYFFTSGREFAMKAGRYFVERFVYAQPGHPHSLDTYLSGLKSIIDCSLTYLSPDDPANLISVGASLLCVMLVLLLIKKGLTRSQLIAGVLLLVVDLYSASYLDIKMEFATYRKALAPTQVLKILESEKAAGKLGRIYGFRSPDQRLPLTPSQNMLYGIEDIGAYSPLVSQKYYQTIGLFGNINDSNLAITPTPAFVIQRLPILDFLTVSHILSTAKLMHPDLQLLTEGPAAGYYLYGVVRKRSAAHFISDVKIEPDWETLKADFLREGFDPAKTLLLERKDCPGRVWPRPVSSDKAPEVSSVIRSTTRTPEQLVWDITVSCTGFFVIPDLYDAGWKASVNGRSTAILPAFGLFRAIEIERPGKYRIEMEYRP